ncbi:lysophospholipase, putative [Plasmodium ovale]|uniref:Lysophospholipase, putative n=1 Tax=Plasmodium ovale TaxID=36330 RepID=A0A1C3KMD7_PLAOA|nr:lysophospholipase, putative [Plasmodium ovale]
MAENIPTYTSDRKVATASSSDESLDGNPRIGSFINKDGLMLKTYEWLVKYPVGVMILVHALNSHVRFEYLKHNAEIDGIERAILKDPDNYYIYKGSWIESLNKQGYSVYGLDLRGHGESECVDNVKTHVHQFDDLVEDVLQYMNIVHDSICNETGKCTNKEKQENQRRKRRCSLQEKNRKNAVETAENTSKNIVQGRKGECLNVSSSESTFQGSNDSISEHNSARGGAASSNPSREGSNNLRGNLSTSEQSLEDSQSLSSEAKINTLEEGDKKKKTPPFYLMGLSMGGNIVLRVLQLLGKDTEGKNSRLNIGGSISLAGMISIDGLKEKPSYKYFYIPVSKLAAYLLPTVRLSPSLNFEMFPFVNDLFRFDKICHPKPITNKFGNEILNAVDNLHNDIEYIPKDIPVLIIHSTLDSACCYNGVSRFFNRLHSENKEMFTVEDMDHMLPMEPGNERLLCKVIDWLSQRTAEAGGSSG